MRLVPVLILTIALAFAGCFGKSNNDNTGGDTNTTTPSSPTPGSTTPATGTTPTSPTTGGNTTPTPVAVTPKVVKSGTVTWPTDCSTAGSTSGQGGTCAPIAVTLDPGYTTLNFTVTWSCNSTPACASNGATIGIGSLSCPAPPSIDPVNTPNGPPPCVKTGAATPGAAKITPAGDGGMVATYKLTEQ